MNIPIQKTNKSRLGEVDFSKLQFGKVLSDHMFIADYLDGQWQNPRIIPYGNLPISPATSALHYGQAIFEGMKAQASDNGEALIFRPEENWKRLNLSAVRMCIPEVPKDLFMEGLKQLIALDRNWIPKSPKSSLYIRPFIFATEDSIGVKISEHYSFIIFTSPVNPFYANPLKVKVEETFSRAYEGGVGFAKAAGNYGSSLYATKMAQDQGFNQVLWMDAKEHTYLEETGTTNVFVVIGDEVITPALSGTILDGITRRSCIDLLKDQGVKVSERRISIHEIVEANAKGLLKEAFCTGTASTVMHIASIGYKDQLIELPEISKRKWGVYLSETLEAIKCGKVSDKFNWIVKV